MKKLLLTMLFVLTAAASAEGQGAFYRIGPFPQSGLAYVCPAPDGGTPCPSPSAIFSNATLTTALNNPISMAQGATVSFYIAAGQYTIQFPASGYNQIVQIGGGGISSVSSLPACANATGTIVSYSTTGTGATSYGAFYCGGIGVVAQTPDNPGQTVSPLSYGGKFDLKFVYDATFSNNSPTVTCPQSDCGFTSNIDASKIVFGTNMANIASNIGTGLITAQNTILTVNSANSITMSANATANCVATGSPLCGLVWATQDDAPSIVSAATAAWGTNGVCKAVQFPSAFFLFSSAFMNMTVTQLSQACGGSQGVLAASGIDTTQVGPEAFGQGPANSVGFPSPSFAFAGCTGGNSGTACLFGTGNLEIHDFGINGMGQTLSGNPHTVNLVELGGSTGGGSCTGSTGFNLGFSGWALQSSGSAGLSLGNNACGDPVYTNIVSEQFGATNCKLVAAQVTNVSGLACFGATTTVLNLACSNNTWQINTYAGEYFDMLSAGPVIVQNGCVWNSSGENIQNNALQSSGTVYQNSSGSGSTANIYGAFMTLNSANSGTSQVFFVNPSVSGTNIHVKNTQFVWSGANNRFANFNANVAYWDDGGNQYGTPGGTNSTIAGDFIADGHSIKAACSGTVTASLTTGGIYNTGPNIAATACNAAPNNAAPGTLGVGIPTSGARTLFGLLIKASAAGTNASSGVFTVMKNGAATAITCTVGTGTSCVDFLHSVSAADGDFISIQYTTQAADTLAGLKAITMWN